MTPSDSECGTAHRVGPTATAFWRGNSDMSSFVSAFEDSDERRFLDRAREALGKEWCTEASCAAPETLPGAMEEVLADFGRLTGGRERILSTVAAHPGLLGPCPAALVLCERVFRSCEAHPEHALTRSITDIIRRYAEQLAWVSIVTAPDPAHIRVALHFGMQWVRDRGWLQTARLGNAVGIKLRGHRLCYDCGAVLEGDDNLQRHRAAEHADRGRIRPVAMSSHRLPTVVAPATTLGYGAPAAVSIKPHGSMGTVPHSVPHSVPAARLPSAAPAYDPTDPYGSTAPSASAYDPTDPYGSGAPSAGSAAAYTPRPYVPMPSHSPAATGRGAPMPTWTPAVDPTGQGREAYDPFG